MKCKQCSSELSASKRGPQPRFCGKACAYRFNRESTLEKYHASKGKTNGRACLVVYRTCPSCSQLFVCGRVRRITCGRLECLAIVRSENANANQLEVSKPCDCRHCGAAFIGKSHNAVFCSDYCFNSHNKSARIARKRSVPTEFVSVKVLHDRDGGRCQLCRKVVDIALAWPHRKSASIDHIVPLSRGGHDTYANTQLAHLACNGSKGNRMKGNQLLLIG